MGGWFPSMQTKMKKILYLIVVTIATLTYSCSKGNAPSDELAVAESLVVECPDSAVAILAGMDTTRMSDLQRARQGLLFVYTQTIYGNPMPLDSTALTAGDESFEGRFDSNEVKWLILKSSAAFQNGNPVARIELLKDAEFLATQMDDRFDLGIIYLHLAKVYEQGFNGTVSKYYAEKAADIFHEVGSATQERHARMAIAASYCVNRDYRSMLDALLAMRSEVMANAPEGYRMYFQDQLARAYDSQGDTRKAIHIWHSIYDGKELTSNILAHWAHAYCRINELDSAYMFIRRANSLPKSNTDEYLCRNVERDILEKMGRKRELPVIDSLRDAAGERIMSERQLEESSLALNIKYDATARQAWMEAAESRRRSGIAVSVAVLAAVLAVAVYLFFYRRNRMLRLEHENDVLKIQALKDNLFESDDRNRNMSSRISELFKTRFKFIDSLAASYFECRDTPQEQKRIYAEVRDSLSEFSSVSSTAELEEIVNGYHDNIMARFHEDFPKLSASQRRLALYLFCGFSLPSISIFTGTDIRNIYVYKSRLKGVINKSESPFKEEYLSYFA